MAKKMAKNRKKNSGPGNPAKRAAQNELNSRLTPGDQRVLRSFSEWAAGQDVLSAPSIDLEEQGLNGLLASLRAQGVDPTTPDAVSQLAQVGITKTEDAEESAPGLGQQVAEACFGVLGDYLRFREEEADDPSPWLSARLKAQAFLDEYFGDGATGEESDLEAHLDSVASAETDQLQRRDAVMGLGPLAGVGPVLAWIGEGRETDRAGEPLEADRTEIWGMLGGDGEVDLAVLTSWWDNLITSEVLDVEGGRVTPGDRAATWAAPTGPSVDEAEQVAQGLVAELSTRVAEDAGRIEAVELLAWALAPALPAPAADASALRAQAVQELTDLDAPASDAVSAAFATLARLGFVTGSLSSPEIPAPLYRVVAGGLRLGLLYTALDEEDLFGDLDDELELPEGTGFSEVDFQPLPKKPE